MKENQLVARLAYVDFEAPIEEINFDVEKHCPKIVTGINKLIEWLEK